MLAYFRGEDAYAIGRAVEALAAEMAAAGGAPVGTWRVAGAEVDPAALAERLATQPLFGGGMLAVVEGPGPLLRAEASRAALVASLAQVAPGNGLVFVELVDATARPQAALASLREVIAASGGRVREFTAPTRERMETFIETRARELGISLDPAAVRLLAERVGAFVREGDVDRRRQTQLASAELEKLALYRPAGHVAAEDVRALVPEAVPGSSWGFLDAVGGRRCGEAVTLLGRLEADGVPLPVLVFQLHRRLRELILVREHLAAGASPARLMRALKLKEFRARKLAEQAATWTFAELEDALEGLLEVDVAVKALDGRASSEADRQLAVQLWLTERVARRSEGGPEVRSGA